MRRLYLLSNGDINVRIAAKVIEADENTDFKREVSEFVKETGVEYMMVTINPLVITDTFTIFQNGANRYVGNTQDLDQDSIQDLGD